MTLLDPAPPDFELKLLLAVCHRLPRVRGSGVLATLLRRFYLRKPRLPVLVRVLGNQMSLSPTDFLEGAFLFFPQLCEADELDFLRGRLVPGDIFLDVGTHIGFYTLQLSRAVGPQGRVVSIEADPENCQRLLLHLRLNTLTNVTVVDCGVADQRQTLRLGRNESGNTGGHSFLHVLDAGVEVQCEPLLEILRARRIERVAAAKIDIEGMEYRVLRRFLADAPRSLWPRAIVIEFHPYWVELSGGNVVELLLGQGYRTMGQKGDNHFLALGD